MSWVYGKLSAHLQQLKNIFSVTVLQTFVLHYCLLISLWQIWVV